VNIHPKSRVAMLLAVAGLSAAACGGGGTPTTPATATTAATSSRATSNSAPGDDFEDDAEIGGGRHLHLACEGSGEPTVIFDAGLGTGMGTWAIVQKETATFARACAYDRAGIGQSSHQTGTKTTEDVIADLRALIEAAELQPPFLLVGHSVSGFSLRLFAGRHRGELAGEVYVDPATPHQPDEVLAVIPPKQAGEDETLPGLRSAWTGWPEPGMTSEHYDIDASEAAVDAVTSFGDLPLVVLTASQMGIDTVPADVRKAVMDRWFELHERLARLSSKGQHRIVDAAHSIHDTRPEVVVDAVRELVEAWRAR
jgi:pimeloyl-ACP methyl ester carboxylesterase